MKNWKNMWLVLSFVLILSLLAACGGESEESSNESSSDNGGEGGEESVDYPTQAIEIAVPFAAGGTTDIAARAVASALPKYLPNEVTVNVVNYEGGGGVTGMMQIFSAEPDGYKIGMGTIGPTTLQPHSTGTAYQATDFEPISQVVGTPNVLIVPKDAPYDNYEEWAKYVEENPGEFSYGTSGAGLTQHITFENFTLETGLELTHIPFDGGAPAIAGMLGGHVDGALVQNSEATPQVESGEAKAIVNTGSYKTEGLEDVPLLTDVGVDIATDVWTGLMAPPETPQEIIDILDDAVEQALQDEQVIEQFTNVGVTPLYLNSEDFGKLIEDSNDTNKQILEQLGMTNN